MEFVRDLISDGNSIEGIVGFSRTVRVGPLISIGGTAPVDAVIDVGKFGYTS